MERFFLFCFRSCLKGEGEKEYYDVLELDPNSKITAEIVKRQYKKLSLTLHPDKLAQRGVEVTQEHKTRFLKLKEAYDVLSDLKRKRLYDEYGESGLKLLENPAEMNHLELLRNFQRNRGDRTTLGLLIAFIFACILLLPILFSLKSDGTLGHSAPWVAIWSPMWLVDLVLLFMAVMVVCDGGKKKAGADEEEDQEEEEKLSIIEKLKYLISTLSFVILQIFVTMRIDKYIDWSWYAVFVPWYVYEALTLLSLVPVAFFTTVHPPNHENMNLNLEEGNGEEDIFMQKMKLETEYFEKVMEVQRAKKSCLVCALRLWQAFFLASQLDHHYYWNWGLVFLPIWVYLFVQYGCVIIFRAWGQSKLKGLDAEAIMSGNESDPVVLVKFQQGNELMAYSSLLCITQLVPLFMAVMLVCRLQTSSSYSTFLIILPVFIMVGCSCCIVFCGLCCLTAIDMDSLEEEMNKAQRGEGAEGTGEDATYQPPEPAMVLAPAAQEATYGTFEVEAQQSPLQGGEAKKTVGDEKKKDDLEANSSSSSQVSSQKDSGPVQATGINLDID